MKLVLVGNQNCGKTTIYNYLTGSCEKIGNWPGVTIDVKFSRVIDSNHFLIDLPGIYSLSPYSNDEVITTNYLINNNYDFIINVIDINLIERSLFLTLELLSLNKNMLILLTHTSKYKKEDIIMNIKVIENKIGIKVIDIEDIKKDRNILFMNIENSDVCNYKHFSIMENYRFKYIEDIINNMNVKVNNCFLDKIFLNRVIGIPFFLVIMAFIYYVSIVVVGNITNNYILSIINNVKGNITLILMSLNVYEWLISLIVNGIIKGISMFICFIPQLLVFFMLMEILNQSGYIARVSFLLDGLLNKIGLSGKSIMCFIVGMGCSVPGIMQSRIIENNIERNKIIFLTPFIPCSAKLTIIMVITNYLGCNYLLIIIYLLSICIIIVSSLIINKIFVLDNNNYIMELPNYKIPKARYILREVMNKLIDFMKRTYSIVLISSILIWIFMNIYVNNVSLLYFIGRWLSLIFYPFLGGNSWILSVSILEGLIAREQVITSLNVIINNNLNMFSKHTIISFLIFNMYSIPCINTIITMRNELGSLKNLFLYLLFQFIIAFFVSVIAYRIGIIIW